MINVSFERIIDVVFGLIFLCAAAPFLALALLLTLIDGHKSPVFTQRRLGLNCKEFTIYKFRTMKAAPVTDKPKHFKPGAAELTPIARFMRSTGLDELPQLFNILKGDMTLIGPRPHALEYANHYESIVPQYKERYSVRPGLACIVEVTALHYLTETPAHIHARIKCDLYYVSHKSVLLDCKIFYKMLRYVLEPNARKALQLAERFTTSFATHFSPSYRRIPTYAQRISVALALAYILPPL